MRASVIGCGAIAAQHLPFLQRSPLVELVAVCDSSPVTAEFAKSRFGAARAYADFGCMLDEAAPEVVHVLTPPRTHRDLVRASLDFGAHVICEKPMAADASETAELLDHAERRDRMLFESRNYLFNDPVMQLRSTIEEDRIGEVLEIDLLLSVNFLAGVFGDRNLAGPVDLPGGAVHDFLPHLTYLFLHLSGHRGEVDDATGVLENRSANPRAAFDFLDSLIFASDVRGRLRITADVRPETFRVNVRGTRASVETDLFNPYLRFEGPPNVGKRTALGQIRNGLTLAGAGLSNFANKVMQHGPYHGMPRMLEAMYRAFRGESAAPFGRVEILDSARLVDRLVALKDVRA